MFLWQRHIDKIVNKPQPQRNYSTSGATVWCTSLTGARRIVTFVSTVASSGGGGVFRAASIDTGPAEGETGPHPSFSIY